MTWSIGQKNDSQAPLRHTKVLTTVASFRTWRGSRAFVAQDPAIKTQDLYGGEGGIRTHGTLPHTRFPSVLLRPLGHLSAQIIVLSTVAQRSDVSNNNTPPEGEDGEYTQNVKKNHRLFILVLSTAKNGREGGIRTHGALAGTTDFESVPFDHSGTPPSQTNCTETTIEQPYSHDHDLCWLRRALKKSRRRVAASTASTPLSVSRP